MPTPAPTANAPSGGPASRRPIHPAFVATPLGGLVAAAVFDVISAADGGRHAWGRDLYRAATFVMMVATSVMFLAILSGLVDRAAATTKGTAVRARANRHGVVMAAVVLGSVVDLTLRRQTYADAVHTPAAPLVVTLLTLAVAVVGGWLGGRLTYRDGVNVAAFSAASAPTSRTTPTSPSGT